MKIILLTQNRSREWSVPTGSTAGSGWLISSQYHRPINCGFWQTRWNQYTPVQLRWAKGIISSLSFTMVDFRQNTMLDRTPIIPKHAHKERAGVSFVRSNQSLVNFPHKGQWCGALMFFLILRLNKWLSKQSWGWWFEKLSHPLWRHCNGRICHHH